MTYIKKCTLKHQILYLIRYISDEVLRHIVRISYNLNRDNQILNRFSLGTSFFYTRYVCTQHFTRKPDLSLRCLHSKCNESYSLVAPVLNNLLIKNSEHTFFVVFNQQILHFLWLRPYAYAYAFVQEIVQKRIMKMDKKRDEPKKWIKFEIYILITFQPLLCFYLSGHSNAIVVRVRALAHHNQ